MPRDGRHDFARGHRGRSAALEAWVSRSSGPARRRRRGRDVKRLDLLLGAWTEGRVSSLPQRRDARRRRGCRALGGAGRGGRLPGEAALRASPPPPAPLPRPLPGATGAAARRNGRVLRSAAQPASLSHGTYAGGGMTLSRSPTRRRPPRRARRRELPPRLLRELSRVHTGGHVKKPATSTNTAAKSASNRQSIRPLGVEADGDVPATPRRVRVMTAALR